MDAGIVFDAVLASIPGEPPKAAIAMVHKAGVVVLSGVAGAAGGGVGVVAGAAGRRGFAVVVAAEIVIVSASRYCAAVIK